MMMVMMVMQNAKFVPVMKYGVYEVGLGFVLRTRCINLHA